MKKFGILVVTISAVVFLSGCMHTVVGNGRGVASPDGRFTLAIESHGASGKAYVDTSKKRVFVWIITKPSSPEKRESLFFGKYVFRGANLCSHVRWQSSQEVTVDFYDFGDRVRESQAGKLGTPSNHIASIDFVFDAQTGKFSERK